MKKNNKKFIIIGIVVILIVLLIPIIKVNDNGTKEYSAISYKVTKYDNVKDSNGTKNGTVVKVFGIKVYDSLDNKKKEVFKVEPIGYKWDAHVYSGILLDLEGEDYKNTYNNFLDALLEGKEKVACKEEEMAFQIISNLKELFPPTSQILRDYKYKKGYMYFTYNLDKNGRDKLINEFGKRVEEIVNGSVMKGDNDAMKAIGLYHYFASRIEYDYDALDKTDNGDPGDLSAYRGIMDYSGICQTFGPAYSYLLNVVGVNAIDAGGLNVDPSVDAHSWTLMEIDDKYYFGDVTFENGSTSGNGLRYFGMDKDRREMDGYLVKDTDLGFNNGFARKYDLSDKRFDSLSACDEVTDIKRDKDKMDVICITPRGEAETFSIDR